MIRALSSRSVLLIVFAMAFAPRYICLVLSSETLTVDNVKHTLYWKLSEELLDYSSFGTNDKTVPDQNTEPLYPFVLAVSKWLFGRNLFLLIAVQAAIASAGAFYLYKLSLLLSSDKKVALVAAVLFSFYPYLIKQTVEIIEVSLYMTLLIAGAYHFCVSMPYSFILSGIVFGLAFLTRSTALPIVVFLAILLIIRRKPIETFVFSCAFLFVVFPYCLRNYHLSGMIMPTRGGWNLIKGNCIYSDDIIPEHSVDLLDQSLVDLARKDIPDIEKRSRKEWNDYYQKKSIEFMLEDPIRTLKQKLMYFLYLFYPRIVPFYSLKEGTTRAVIKDGKAVVENPVQRSLISELLYAIPFTFILVTCLVGIYLRRSSIRNDIPLFLIALSFIVVFTVYWPAARLRVPMDFILIFYSAVTVTFIMNRIMKRQVAK